MTRQQPPATHTHDGSDEPDLWKWLDLAVIVALVLLVILGAEWVAGKVIRENLAKGAQEYLAKVRASKTME